MARRKRIKLLDPPNETKFEKIRRLEREREMYNDKVRNPYYDFVQGRVNPIIKDDE